MAMEYKDGLIQGFELKYRSLDDDTERYLFALVDLLDSGKIEKVEGQSLYQSHYADAKGHDWIIDSYFEQERFDQIEAYFTPSGETFFGPLHEGTLKILERFEALGEKNRVQRIWRAHIGLLKSQYWLYINERKKGFRHEPKIMNVSEQEQRASHDRFVGQIPQMKKTLLQILSDFHRVLERIDAPGTAVTLLEADMDAVRAEERPKPQGKKDNRPMDEDVFWEIIGTDLDAKTMGERLESMPNRLALFKPAAIREFDRLLREMDARAYRNDVWALAYLLQGGCSDDAFDAFRGWLILQGEAVFKQALEDPDGFDVSLHHGEAGGMDLLREVAPIAHELRQGKPMRPVKTPPLELGGPDWEEEEFADRLPNIAKALGS